MKQKYALHFTNKKFLFSLFFSILLLIGSLFLNFYASMYATERASNAVTDIILSNIRVYDVDLIFVFGPLVMWIFVAILCVIEPKRTPFILKNIAIFVIIRSIFISLTHIGPFPIEAITTGSQFIGKFTFGGDLFFSAHTGLPFLMALIFWQDKYLRWIFTITSILFGIVVLLGHYHYSIDVLSAFFITYTIFQISSYIFKKDKNIFSNTTN